MLYWYNWFSWWWARGCSKHVENWNKHIEKNCASSWSFTKNYFLRYVCPSDPPSLTLFIIFCVETPPMSVQVQQTGEQFPLVQARVHFHCHVPQNVRWPKTLPQNSGWKCHSTPFDTVVPLGTLFCQPQRLSEPPDCRNKYKIIFDVHVPVHR